MPKLPVPVPPTDDLDDLEPSFRVAVPAMWDALPAAEGLRGITPAWFQTPEALVDPMFERRTA